MEQPVDKHYPQQIMLAISLLLHFLLLSSFVVSWHFSPTNIIQKPEQERPPAYYVPSYTTSDNALASPPSQPMPQKAPPTPQQKKVDSAKDGIEKAATKQPPSQAPTPIQVKSEKEEVSRESKINDGVHLVGDKNVDKPLIKLLGTALSHSLIYPRIAVDFNLRGSVYVGFTIHPNGMVTGVRVVKSSGEDVLDRAASEGVSAMSPVVNVNTLLQEPKYLVVGIIFS